MNLTPRSKAKPRMPGQNHKPPPPEAPKREPEKLAKATSFLSGMRGANKYANQFRAKPKD